MTSPDPDPAPTRTITVLYFAAASTATGLTSERIALPPSGSDGFPLSSLPALLAARHAGTGLEGVLAGSGWAVDGEMVEEGREGSVVLRGGEEVAVICPVSGG